MRKLRFVLAFALLALPSFALADAPGQTPPQKTLPSTPSATAQANAFGQQGDRMRAAHQSAKAAAAQQAHHAADQHVADSHANSHASARSGNASSHAATGLAHAAAAGGNGAAGAAHAH